MGLAARFGLPGALGDVAGGIGYAALVYVVVAFLVPRWRPARVGLVALALAVAVELFQLTDVPAELARNFSPIKLVLGSSFAALDLASAAIGAALATWVDSRVHDGGRR